MGKVLIASITGQGGPCLAELLLAKDYEVHSMIRRSSSFNAGRIDHLYRDPREQGCRLFLHYGDLNDASFLNRLLREIHPDEICNLGAQSRVRVSFDIPEYTAEVDVRALALPRPNTDAQLPSSPPGYPGWSWAATQTVLARP